MSGNSLRKRARLRPTRSSSVSAIAAWNEAQMSATSWSLSGAMRGRRLPHGRLQAGEGEVEPRLALERARKIEALGVAVPRRLLDVRAAGIGQADQLRGLVEGLAERIVDGRSPALVVADAAHQHHLRVTARNGRIHTSTATVAVMPEAEEVEVEVDENDLKIDVYRSTGPGGQSVNTTDSAVRITHLPTGVVVAMQDEKSQLQNKVKAMRVLRARLYELERERQQSELAAQRRSQIGTGERAEKIRTYNFPESRVTDHRIKLTEHRLDQIVGGELGTFTEALQAEERKRALE